MGIEQLFTPENTKAILPYLTGGLAGAFFTYIMKFWGERKSEKRLSINAKSIDYSLPDRQRHFDELQVSYRKKSYTKLTYIDIEIRNVGRPPLLKPIFAIKIGADAEILDSKVELEPISSTFSFSQEPNNKTTHSLSIENMQRNDVVHIYVLLAGEANIDCYYRGQELVEIARSKVESMRLEKRVEWLLFLMALFIMAGALPDEVRHFAQGLIFFTGIPLIMKLFQAIREARLIADGKPEIQLRNINLGGGGNLVIHKSGKDTQMYKDKT